MRKNSEYENVGESRRDETRAALFDAALRLFGRHGYRRVTVDEIAAEAHLSRRTFYLHFRSKEDLALRFFDEGIAQLVAQLQEQARAEAPAAQRLERMLIGRVLFLFDRMTPLREQYDEILADLRIAYMPRRDLYLRDEAAVLRDVLAAGKAEGTLAVEDPLAVAHTLLLATNALMPFSLSPARRADRDYVIREATQLAALLLRGLRPFSTP